VEVLAGVNDKGPELGISGPALRGLAVGGDSPPRDAVCIDLILLVSDLFVQCFLKIIVNILGQPSRALDMAAR
jgi:hypothetical protein